MFVWDACKDLTLIILMVAAAASLALGIKSEVRLHASVMMQFFAFLLRKKCQSCWLSIFVPVYLMEMVDWSHPIHTNIHLLTLYWSLLTAFIFFLNSAYLQILILHLQCCARLLVFT